MSMRIESHQNPRIKELQKLTKRRRRELRQVTLVEGSREAWRALQNGVVPVEAFVCREVLSGEIERAGQSTENGVGTSVDQEPISQESGYDVLGQLEALDKARKCRLFEVSPALFNRIAYRGDSGGLLLVVPYMPLTLDGLARSPDPFYVVVENVEKPGNLGAILRTADAVGVDGVIVTNSPEFSPTDIHSPNTIRSSLGTVFSVAMAQAETADAIRWLKQEKINIVTTSPDSELVYTQGNFAGATAIVMGSEAHGVSQAWFDAADSLVTIPMRGIADSLNLSTSTAVMLYEVLRQRSED